MPAQLAIENPLLEDSKVYEPHKDLATKLANMLPDFMTVTLEPIEGTIDSRLTISVKYAASVNLSGIETLPVEIIKDTFINAYKQGVNSL